MTPDKFNEPAFPRTLTVNDGIDDYKQYATDGISIRVHAAIQLRVPDSGIPELDAMILEARRLDWAGMALVAHCANQVDLVEEEVVTYAYTTAESMLSRIAYHAKQD